MLDANTREAAKLRPDARYVSLPIEAGFAMDGHSAVFAQAMIGFLSELSGT
jgi:hypothetical protein